MIRAWLYVGVSGAIWFAEGFLFSRFLAFSHVQTAILATFYFALYTTAVLALRRYVQQPANGLIRIEEWRLLSVTPMIATVVGSFVSLPVVLLVLALGMAV